jgi:hypothetical protein
MRGPLDRGNNNNILRGLYRSQVLFEAALTKICKQEQEQEKERKSQAELLGKRGGSFAITKVHLALAGRDARPKGFLQFGHVPSARSSARTSERANERTSERTYGGDKGRKNKTGQRLDT